MHSGRVLYCGGLHISLAVEGVGEHAINVDDLAGWCRSEFPLQTAGTALDDCGARPFGQLHTYRFFTADRTCENGWELLLDNFDNPSSPSAQVLCLKLNLKPSRLISMLHTRGGTKTSSSQNANRLSNCCLSLTTQGLDVHSPRERLHTQ